MKYLTELVCQESWRKLLRLGALKVYQPKDIIYFQNEPAKGLYYLHTGCIKNSVLFSDGSEKIFALLEAPNLTAETSVIDGGPNICMAIAVTTCEVVFLPNEIIIPALLDNMDLMLLFMKISALKMRCVNAQAQDMSASILERLAHMLLDYKKYALINSTDDGRLKITHDELANFLGTTRPQITEHLLKLKQQHLISSERGYLKILDYEGLRKIARI